MTGAKSTARTGTWMRLLQWVRPHWRVFALGVLAMALTAACEPVLPALMKPLLDEGFGTASGTGPKWWIPAAFVGLFVARGVTTFVTDYCLSWVANRVLGDLREAMFARLLTLPSAYFAGQSPGKLVSRLVFEVNNVTSAATDALTNMVKETLVVVGLLGWLLWLNWRLTLVALVLVPLLALAMHAFNRRARRLSRENLAELGRISQVVEEGVAGHEIVKIYGGQAREQARFRRASDRLRAFARRFVVARATLEPTTQLVAAVAVALVIWIAMEQSRQDQTTVGGFVSFITAMLMLLAPLKRIAGVNSTLQRGLASAEAVFDLLDEVPEADAGTRTLGRARGDIAFERITVRYAGAERAALDGIDLAVRAGEVIALVGPSGGGKSTLVNLLPRLVSPESGQVRVDGVPVQELSLASLRAQVAMVSQHTVLFDDSVAANIAYGAGPEREPSRAEIAAVAEAAQLGDWLATLPQGLDTPVGHDGVLLSGGQRQRLAIARALLKDAPILILDEATSALDNESERAVQRALATLMKGRTTLVIAHRLDTVRHADRILVLAGGRIVESGTHDALAAAGGLYATLLRGSVPSEAVSPASAPAGQGTGS